MLTYEEIICQSIDTIVTAKLKTLNFDTTLVCTVLDNSTAEQGTYLVFDGSTKFTAYSSDSTYKIDEQVYVAIPNNDFSGDKIITGRKKVNDSNIPYIYKSPFASFVKASNNLVTMSSDFDYSLIANGNTGLGDIKEIVNESGEVVSYAESIVIPLNTQTLPQTEIPYTRLGIKADFKSLLSDFITQGNYGLGIIVIGENEKRVEALDCQNMYGNPYQFFTYINQEMVLEIPDSIGKIKEIILTFFQDGSFNNIEQEEEDQSLDWISSQIGGTTNKSPNIFVSNIELYLGYDMADFSGNNYKIFIDNQEKYKYNYNNGLLNTRILRGEWVHIDENTGNSLIISSNNPPMPEKIKWNQVLQGYVWPKDEEKNIYYGIKWYHGVYGMPSSDGYAGVGWEILNFQDINNNPMQITVSLDNNKLEERFKSIVFDDLTFGKINETDDVEAILSSKPIVSNTILFSNEDYEINTAVNKQNQLNIIPMDNSEGYYYVYDLSGEINDKDILSEKRILNIYFEGEKITNIYPYKVEWIVPYGYSMFNRSGYKIMGMPLEEINISEYKNFIQVIDLNGFKNTAVEGDIVKFKKIIINNFGENNETNNCEVDLEYQIASSYNPQNINNIIDCKIYRPYDDIPYSTSRRFYFGTGNTSGTEATFYLECNKISIENKKTINSNPVIKLDNSLQCFKIIPRVVLNNTQEEIDWPKSTIAYTWYNRDESPKGLSISSDKDGNAVIDPDDYSIEIIADETAVEDYSVLQATLSYGEYQNLTTYLSFAYTTPIIKNDIEIEAELPEGPFQIIYDSASGLPFETYFTPYSIDNLKDLDIQWKIQKYNKNGEWQEIGKLDNDISDLKELNYYPRINSNNILVPATLYIDNLSNVSIRALDKTNNKLYWSQPLLILKNKFPNSLINEWNGNLIQDEENNVIMSAMMVAGTKNEENKFSGLVIGKPQGQSDSSLDLHGLYGYNRGNQAFAFKEDGTAFIGANGQGRIEFNGIDSVIKARGYDEGYGTCLDLDNNYLNMQALPQFTEEQWQLFIKALYELNIANNYVNNSINIISLYNYIFNTNKTGELQDSDIEELKKNYYYNQILKSNQYFLSKYQNYKEYENLRDEFYKDTIKPFEEGIGGYDINGRIYNSNNQENIDEYYKSTNSTHKMDGYNSIILDTANNNLIDTINLSANFINHSFVKKNKKNTKYSIPYDYNGVKEYLYLNTQDSEEIELWNQETSLCVEEIDYKEGDHYRDINGEFILSSNLEIITVDGKTYQRETVQEGYTLSSTDQTTIKTPLGFKKNNKVYFAVENIKYFGNPNIYIKVGQQYIQANDTNNIYYKIGDKYSQLWENYPESYDVLYSYDATNNIYYIDNDNGEYIFEVDSLKMINKTDKKINVEYENYGSVRYYLYNGDYYPINYYKIGDNYIDCITTFESGICLDFNNIPVYMKDKYNNWREYILIQDQGDLIPYFLADDINYNSDSGDLILTNNNNNNFIKTCYNSLLFDNKDLRPVCYNQDGQLNSLGDYLYLFDTKEYKQFIEKENIVYIDNFNSNDYKKGRQSTETIVIALPPTEDGYYRGIQMGKYKIINDTDKYYINTLAARIRYIEFFPVVELEVTNYIEPNIKKYKTSNNEIQVNISDNPEIIEPYGIELIGTITSLNNTEVNYYKYKNKYYIKEEANSNEYDYIEDIVRYFYDINLKGYLEDYQTGNYLYNSTLRKYVKFIQDSNKKYWTNNQELKFHNQLSSGQVLVKNYPTILKSSKYYVKGNELIYEIYGELQVPYMPYYTEEQFFELLPKGYILSLNGDNTKDTALAIGESEEPYFQVDWNGNVTLRGDLQILDADGNSILEVTNDHLELNLGNSTLSDTLDSLAVSIDNHQAALEVYEAGTFVTTQGVFDKNGLTITNSESNTKTNIDSDGLDIISKLDGKPLLEVTSEGVQATNLEAKNYFIIDKIRIGSYGNNRMGCFWIGG